MTVLSDLLFTDGRNETYKQIVELYHSYWTDTDNVKRILKTPITTCILCSSFDKEKISVLGLYYDSMSVSSVTLLDAAVVTIMCLLEDDQLSLENIALKHLVETLNPDVIRNHYFLNVCCEREKCINDWDVIEILKTLMLSFKTSTVCLRQFANLTKLLKKECLGTCNTFKTTSQLDVIENQQRSSTPLFFISQLNKGLTASREKKNNTANRLKIVCTVLNFPLLH